MIPSKQMQPLYFAVLKKKQDPRSPVLLYNEEMNPTPIYTKTNCK